jgi:hypothetical protein
MDCISSEPRITERYSIVEDNKNIPLFSKPEITKKLPAVVPTKIKKLITMAAFRFYPERVLFLG